MKIMTSPLKIMSKIESHEPMVDDVTSDLGEWQSLRKAIEAERSSYQAKIDGQAEELAQKDTRIARLEEFLQKKRHSFKGGMGSPHIKAVDEILNETDRQSIAAVKAEALRVWADEAENEAPTCDFEKGWNEAVLDARYEADRIEQEAKE